MNTLPLNIYLSIVVPLYNEEESISILVHKILESVQPLGLSYEVVLVDDGSDDRTWEIIESLVAGHQNVRGVKLKRNFGQTSAMVAGFEQARGEIIVTLDGDLQNDPADIPMLLEKINQGYDIVSGWRKNRQDHTARVLPSRVANYLISVTTGVRLHDYGCSLKAYKAKCIKSLKAYGEMHRFFPALASMTGASVTEIQVNHYPRVYGVSKYGFDRILKVFSDIFAMNLIIRFSSFPLKGFTMTAIPFALLTLFLGFLGILAVVLSWTPGKAFFFTLAAGLCGLSVIHLIMLGVLGELVVNTSDLTQAQLPEISKKEISINNYKDN
ncbi:MAG: glycosyltransferase family 2 protein [Desulfosalsimonas sp.]